MSFQLQGDDDRAFVNDGSAFPVSSVSQLSAREREMFLGVIQESLVINHHFQLFLWLQGSLQYFLPHDVLIAAVADSGARRFKLDIVSALPGVDSLGCQNCRRDVISDWLYERWKRNQRQMLSFESSVGSLINETCDCNAVSGLRSMRSALVHGLHDERSGEDAVYVVLSADHAADARQRAMFALLLPQIDFVCRRAQSAPIDAASASDALDASLAEIREDAGISSREQEILGWVRAGKTNYEIGQILNISTFTVKNHLQRIYRKIDVINRTQAVAKLDEYARGR
jgi:transcriptional regulator EpsA